jgi:hypothetical protein
MSTLREAAATGPSGKRPARSGTIYRKPVNFALCPGPPDPRRHRLVRCRQRDPDPRFRRHCDRSTAAGIRGKLAPPIHGGHARPGLWLNSGAAFARTGRQIRIRKCCRFVTTDRPQPGPAPGAGSPGKREMPVGVRRGRKPHSAGPSRRIRRRPDSGPGSRRRLRPLAGADDAGGHSPAPLHRTPAAGRRFRSGCALRVPERGSAPGCRSANPRAAGTCTPPRDPPRTPRGDGADSRDDGSRHAR